MTSVFQQLDALATIGGLSERAILDATHGKKPEELLGVMRYALLTALESYKTPALCSYAGGEYTAIGDTLVAECNLDHPVIEGFRFEALGEGQIPSVIMTLTAAAPDPSSWNGGQLWWMGEKAGPREIRFTLVRGRMMLGREEVELSGRALTELIQRYFHETLPADFCKAMQPTTIRLHYREGTAEKKNDTSAKNYRDIVTVIEDSDLPLLDDIIGHATAKQTLRDALSIFANPELAKAWGLKPEHTLLAGEPGNGKTMLARAMAGEVRRSHPHINVLELHLNSLFGELVGHSERNTRGVFEFLRTQTPFIGIFDEAEGVFRRRGHDNLNPIRDDILNMILKELDGIRPLDGGMLICTTNRPDIMDPAMLRPGRLGKVIGIAPLQLKEKILLAKKHIAALDAARCAWNVPDAFVRATMERYKDQWSAAHISGLFQALRLAGFQRQIAGEAAPVAIDQEHFRTVVQLFAATSIRWAPEGPPADERPGTANA